MVLLNSADAKKQLPRSNDASRVVKILHASTHCTNAKHLFVYLFIIIIIIIIIICFVLFYYFIFIFLFTYSFLLIGMVTQWRFLW